MAGAGITETEILRKGNDGESFGRVGCEGGVRWRRRREKPRNRPRRGCSEEIVQRMGAAMAVAAAEPRRKSRRANVVPNFDRKTAADFSGGWSIRLEPLPNRLSANKFPCQTSYERRSRRFLRVGQGWTCAGGNGTVGSNAYADKREREAKKTKREGRHICLHQCPLIRWIVQCATKIYSYNATLLSFLTDNTFF